MKLATTTGDFDRFCDSYTERVQHVCEAGFRYIDLSLYTVKENDALIMRENWRKTAAEMERYADARGIRFIQAHGPNVNAMKSASDFADAVKKTERAIEVCGFLGIPNMVVHPGWDKNASREEWYEKNRDFFRALFPTMEKHRVNILHENTTSANMPWFFPKTGKEMREFSEFVDHPLFHSCWDTGHANIEGAQYDEIMAIGSDLYAVHINDNRGSCDEHLIPFFGTVNMDEVLHALIDANFQGAFTFESGSCLRPEKYWLGNRHSFDKDTRLAQPPLFVQQEMEKLMYHTGVYILQTYNQWEK